MKAYGYSVDYERERVLLALWTLLLRAAGFGILHDLQLADIRNALIANTMSRASVTTAIYFCWIAWFSHSRESWIWKPGDIVEQMREAIELCHEGVIPVYLFWLFIATIVTTLAVSNNKWNRSGFCEDPQSLRARVS